MNNNQFSEERWADQNESYYLYYRDKNINKEIYRSGEGSKYNDLSVEDLVTNGDLILTRACATFSLGAVFYSDSTPIHLDEENTIYMTDEDTFNIVMGDIYKDWYIKIYLGGQCFPTSYNIETNKTFNDHPNGYYSSGDAVKFGNSDLTGKVYLPFNKKSFSIDFETFNGFGYFSDYQNTLLTPVTGTHQLKVYLLIKHWTGGPDGPSEEWLKSDIGALQTIISQSGVVAEPENAAAFKIRFAIELKVFKKAWEDAGGDAAQNELIENAGIDTGTKTSSEDKSSSSLNTAIYSTTLTRSPSGDPVRSFTLPEDAIIIQEVY